MYDKNARLRIDGRVTSQQAFEAALWHLRGVPIGQLSDATSELAEVIGLMTYRCIDEVAWDTLNEAQQQALRQWHEEALVGDLLDGSEGT